MLRAEIVNFIMRKIKIDTMRYLTVLLIVLVVILIIALLVYPMRSVSPYEELGAWDSIKKLFSGSKTTEYQNIRNTVLSSLEQDLEFCEIIKDDIGSDQGEFWLICNGRPFYATYENGNVNHELNGWEFLKKDSSLWNELSNCDFYDSNKKDSSNYQLRFFCPFDLQSDNLRLKIYNFNINSLAIKKESEVALVDVIISEMKTSYEKLNECEFVKYDIMAKKQLKLDFLCGGEKYSFGMYLSALSPPLFDLTNNDNVAKKVENILGKKSEIDDPEKYREIIKWNKNYIPVKVNFDTVNIIFFYSIYDSKISILSYIIEPKDGMEIKDILSEVGNYFIFPPFEKIEHVTFLKSENDMDYYEVDEKIITVISKNNQILTLLRKSEVYYAGI